VSGAALTEAYERFHRTGPEWGADQLTNHGPMAVEVLVRRGRAEVVPRWVDAYIRRLDELPRATGEITDASWPEALGDGRRIGDWTAYFTRQLAEQPWREVLVTWWPRLLPGIAAGATHGVIRTGHVVRTLLTTEDNAPTLDELAHALAFWAARSRPVPAAPTPAGQLDPQAALDAVPRIASQQGNLAARFGQLTPESGWPASVERLRPAAAPGQVPDRLADLVAAATLRYLSHGHGQPVLLVHTATAPNAVLHALPALPDDLWAPSLTAVWTASAAIFAAYAPPQAAPPQAAPPQAAPPPPAGRQGAAAEVLDRAVAHGDEHVIKFTDTAAEVYARTGQADALAAALRVGTLIPSPRD
jgi:Questin oxidase-like